MFFEVTAIARNVAIILLALQFLVVGAVPVFVLLKLTQGLRRLIPKVAPGLRQAHGGLLMAGSYVDKAMARARAPFVWSAQMGERVRALRGQLHEVSWRGR
ncbi:MAG: hypothetical protein V1772_12340 [Chloroflexota bacterium]